MMPDVRKEPSVPLYIGQPLPRDEDRRFLTGLGDYTDDLELSNCAYAVFVRSPIAHGRIVKLSLERAANMPGVLCVLDADRWAATGAGRYLPAMTTVHSDNGEPIRSVQRGVFAIDRVCYVGDTVAAVVAETMEMALDAVEAIDIDYEPLPVVTDVNEAAAVGAPRVHECFDSNILFSRTIGDGEAVERAFRRAVHVTTLDIRSPRITGNPIEPRTYVGSHNRRHDRYTLWATTQLPHNIRKILAQYTFGCSLSKVRVVSPDMGGGFGTKGYYYPEMPVVLYAAKLLQRPVKFTSTRSESLQSDIHGRDFSSRASMAFDSDGKILAVDVDTLGAFGAYQNGFNAVIVGRRFAPPITNLYDVPAARVRVSGVYTHASPTDAYRGVGEPPATVCERLIENGARELGLDPLELRARNYIRSDQFPYRNVLGDEYDSGAPLAQHAKLIALSHYEELCEKRSNLRDQGIRMGIGAAAFVDRSGLGPSRLGDPNPEIDAPTWEMGRVEITTDDRVQISVGTHAHGQGHEITFRQIAADALGLPIARIDFQQGDTDRDKGNSGTGANRSLMTAGMAVHVAGERIVEKAKRLAAHLMEVTIDDVDYEPGQFRVGGTDRTISFWEVAHMAYRGANYPEADFDLGLDETVRFDVSGDTFPTGMQLASVEVDVETGAVDLTGYWAVNDCGTLINPLVVDGQIHGGLVQSMGPALFEHMVYDGEGQLITGSFADYAMPKADSFPWFEVAHLQTPSPTNELGVKGVGETSGCGPLAAIGNAIVNALWDLGVRHLNPPYTSMKVWQALRSVRSAGG